MTKDEIKRLAEARAAAELHMNNLAVANMPTDVSDRIKASAQYKLAYDAFLRAHNDYERAICGLSASELRELAT